MVVLRTQGINQLGRYRTTRNRRAGKRAGNRQRQDVQVRGGVRGTTNTHMEHNPTRFVLVGR